MTRYNTDTAGTNQYIIPLVVIYKGIRADDFELIDQVNDKDKIFLSTQNINFNGNYYQPLLLKDPQSTQTIDTTSKKYRVQNAIISINNTLFHGKRFSDNIKDISNCAIRVYYKSQSCKTLDDCFLISQSTITRYKQHKNSVSLTIEDLTSTSLQKLIPELTPDSIEFASEDRLKPYPIVYGHVDRSPLIKKIDPLVSTVDGEQSVDVLIADTENISKFGNEQVDFNTPLSVQPKLVEGSPLFIYKSDYVNLSNRIPDEYSQLLDIDTEKALYETQNNSIITTQTFKAFQIVLQDEFNFDVPAFGRVLRKIVDLDGKVKKDRVEIYDDNSGSGHLVGGRLYATNNCLKQLSTWDITNKTLYDEMWQHDWGDDTTDADSNYYTKDRLTFPYHTDLFEDWTPDINNIEDDLGDGTSLNGEAIEDTIIPLWNLPYYDFSGQEEGTPSTVTSNPKNYLNHIKEEDDRALCWSGTGHSNAQDDGAYAYWEMILDNLKLKSKCLTYFYGSIGVEAVDIANYNSTKWLEAPSAFFGNEVPVFPHDSGPDDLRILQFPSFPPQSRSSSDADHSDLLESETTDVIGGDVFVRKEFALIRGWESTDQFKSVKMGMPKYTHAIQDTLKEMKCAGFIRFLHIIQDVFIEDSHTETWFANVYGRKTNNLYWKPFNSFITESIPEEVANDTVTNIRDYLKTLGYSHNDTGGESGWLVFADRDIPNNYNLDDFISTMTVIPEKIFYLNLIGSFAYYSNGSWNSNNFVTSQPFIIFTPNNQRINVGYTLIRMHKNQDGSYEEGFHHNYADSEVIARYLSNGWKKYIYQPEINVNDMIEQPHEIVMNLIENEISYKSDNFDEQLIRNIFIAHQGWKMAFTVTEQKTLKETIEELAKNTKMFPRYSSTGEFTFNTYKNYYNMSDVDIIIKSKDVIDFTFDISNIEDVFSQVKLLYKYDYGKKDFSRIVIPSINTVENSFNDYSAMTEFLYSDLQDNNLLYDINRLYNKTDDENDNQIQSKYIRDRYTAEEYKKYIMMQSLNQKLMINLSLSTKYSNIEVGNIIYVEQMTEENALGQKYYAYEAKGGQLLYPFYLVSSVKKTTNRIDIKCERLHRLQYGLPQFFVSNVEQGLEQPQTTEQIKQVEDFGEIYSNNFNYEQDFQSISEDLPEDYNQNIVVEWYGSDVMEGSQSSSVRLDIIQSSEYNTPESFEFLVNDAGIGSDSQTPNFNITSFQENGTGYVIVSAREDNLTENIIEGSITIKIGNNIYNKPFYQKIYEEPNYEKGDVNKDNIINILDVVLLVNYVLGEQELDQEQQDLGDLNGDGGINILDIVALVDRIIG